MGHVEVEEKPLEFPDAISTRANGINNHGLIVGDFRDASNQRHGFLYDGKTFQPLDYPGAPSTIAYKINDTGKIVGSFRDSTGLTHGFLYDNGSFSPIDFPGSIDHTAIALGINNRGDIVGEYDLTVEITHGFILQNGQYRTLDTPFASQTEARGINDRGVIVGDTYDDPFVGPIFGFTLDRNIFGRFDIRGYNDVYETFPLTVNNRGMQGGVYDLSRFGYVTIYGYPYRVYGNGVWGMNDNGQIVGSTSRLSGQTVGYVATLPK
jgi:probable HAF family extracellular repeat protein